MWDNLSGANVFVVEGKTVVQRLKSLWCPSEVSSPQF